MTCMGSRFTWSRAAATLPRISRERLSTPCGSPVQMFSWTVIESNSAAYWKTYPTLRRTRSRVSSPSK